jgi:hypothetical protein
MLIDTRMSFDFQIVHDRSPADHSRQLDFAALPIMHIVCLWDSAASITRSAQRNASQRLWLAVCHNEPKSQSKNYAVHVINQ